MILAVHQPQYLPWLGYFDKIRKSDCFVLLDRVQYKHREYQNRNKIRIKDGWMWLTVPVISKGLRKQLICDVCIDNTTDWQKEHFKSLEVWYGRTKFFNNYIPFFQEVYIQKKWSKLVDLNIFIIKYLVKKLGIETLLCLESDIGTTNVSTERIIEICKKLKADVYLSGIGGKEYLEEDKFVETGIKLLYQDFIHPVYHQQFMSREGDFIPYMSILDLLFNEGPRSREILGLR